MRAQPIKTSSVGRLLKYAQWKRLSEKEMGEACQHLSPMQDWDLFKKIEQEFLMKFGGPEGVESAFCGFCGGLGPLNGITVHTRAGGPVVRLPKKFMGFPVVRSRRK
jgi:hypothetical protein